jgi:hypothetical protein
MSSVVDVSLVMDSRSGSTAPNHVQPVTKMARATLADAVAQVDAERLLRFLSLM